MTRRVAWVIMRDDETFFDYNKFCDVSLPHPKQTEYVFFPDLLCAFFFYTEDHAKTIKDCYELDDCKVVKVVIEVQDGTK